MLTDSVFAAILNFVAVTVVDASELVSEVVPPVNAGAVQIENKQPFRTLKRQPHIYTLPAQLNKQIVVYWNKIVQQHGKIKN
jgi:hypothetical protein